MEPPSFLSPTDGDGGSPRSALERQWLREARDFVRRALLPCGPAAEENDPTVPTWPRLNRALCQCRGSLELPLGYRLISVSELQSQQHQPCCSHLSWSSDEFRKWACDTKGLFPDQRILQRAHLILVGYLTDGKNEVTDGSLYVRDNTGTLPCEVLHFELEWLENLLLFPSWTYIPPKNPSRAGYLEILADPVEVMPGPEKRIDIPPVLDSGQAAKLLSARAHCKKEEELNVAGELSRLSTVLSIHRKVFFFLFLKNFGSNPYIPVLVQSPHLVWHHVLQLGHRYVVTALKISSLKASGLRVFVTSSSSHLLPYCLENVTEQSQDSISEGSSVLSASPVTSTLLSSSLELGEEDKTVVPVKKSKVISYVGTITQVLNAQASLYELDNKFSLCLAYQQQLNAGRALRPGACVELRDVHLLQKPLAAFPFVLGACLHTTLTLKSFSKQSILHQPVASSGNLYVQLLLRYNLTLPQYLFLVSLLETLEQRFCCFVRRQELLLPSGHDATGAAEKFMVPILNSLVPSGKQARDIHQEILTERHCCPLQKCHLLEPPCQIPSFSSLFAVVEKRCLESFSPSQQMSSTPEIQHIGAQELNRKLAWSYCMLSAESFNPPVVLLGVLRSSPSRGSLQLQDSTKALPCIIFHRDESPFVDTSLIGCLLQIEKFQLVVEQFLQSDFPSWQELKSTKYIKEKKTRLCVQFYVEDVTVLHSPDKRAPELSKVCKELSSVAKDQRSSGAEPRSPANTEEDKAAPHSPRPPESVAGDAGGVSRLFLVTQKEGLMWRNYPQGKDDAGPQLCFQATVLWMGKSEQCKGDAKGQKELGASALGEHNGAQPKVLLIFLGKSLQWFPFLHPGGLYQVIIPQCLNVTLFSIFGPLVVLTFLSCWQNVLMDLEVFDKLCLLEGSGNLSNMRDCSSFLPVPDTAYLHHVSWISQVVSEVSEMDKNLFSIAEILNPRCCMQLLSSPVISSGNIGHLHGNWGVDFWPALIFHGIPGLILWTNSRKDFMRIPYWKEARCILVYQAEERLDVYIEATFLPYLWGMLPGAKILFRNLQRKISRFKNVYCTYTASSCLSVLSPPPPGSPSGPFDGTPQLPAVYLSHMWLRAPGLCQMQLTCHLTCVLTLCLRWTCSLCGSIFQEGRCTQHNPPCLSHTGVIKASARILVEDGTGEAAVLCRNQQVREVLALSPKEWDLVQAHVRSKGCVIIQHNDSGIRPGCVEEPKDLLTWYLRSLCRSPLVCRPLVLTARLDRKPSEAGSGQTRRFFSNEVEFLCKMKTPLNLICLSIGEAT